MSTEDLKKAADVARRDAIRQKDFANELWSQLTDFIKNNQVTQTREVPVAGSHKNKAPHALTAQVWPEDELDTLIINKMPHAKLHEIAAEKFVDQVMVHVFVDSQIDLRGSAIECRSNPVLDSYEAEVLLAYVR